MQALSQRLLPACLLLLAAAREEVNDAEAMVQVSLESSSLLNSQIATLKMLSEAMSARASSRSHPHKHHKDGGSSAAASSHPALAAKVKVPAGCAPEDLQAVEWHVKGLVSEYQPKFEQAQKENDADAIKEYAEDLVPLQCDMKKIATPGGIRWDPLQACIQNFTNVSSSCVQCPVRFMQQVAGKTILDVPFSCALKCAPVATASFKCGEATEGCEEDSLSKVAPCLACMSPKFIEFGHCVGMPHASTMEAKLSAVKEALDGGEDKIEDLLKAEFDAGREELEPLVKSGSALNRAMALTLTAVLD